MILRFDADALLRPALLEKAAKDGAMGLTFWVGGTDWFNAPLNTHLERALRDRFGIIIPKERGTESTQYGEVGWSRWMSLQEMASHALGSSNAPHLCYTGAWFSVYLPVLMEPVTLTIASFATPLDCASLPALYDELLRFAAACSLPVEADALSMLWNHHAERAASDETAQDIQTYIQLMLAVRRALSRNLPLWVVK